MKGVFRTTSGKIAEITRGTIISGGPDIAIGCITTDSRETCEDALFIPLRGENFDGHDFIPELMEERRISCSLTMRDGFAPDADASDTGLIRCDDTLAGLGRIAAFHRQKFVPLVVAITGTNGKTTTKELVHSVLSTSFRTIKNEKNYNNEIGVPFTLLRLDGSCEAAVIEMGMNHSGEIERLSLMTRPDIGVVTNAGAGHLEFLGSVENVALAKAEIMKGMKPGSTLVLNRDTECFHVFERIASKLGMKLLTYGLGDGADIRPDSYRMFPDRIALEYSGEKFVVPLYGKHNVYNIMAAVSVAQLAGIDLSKVSAALKDFTNISGRSEIIEREYTVINDTYNSNPLSSLFALESVCEVFPSKRKIAVLADMKELGELAGLYHMRVGQFVADMKFSLLLLYGEMSDFYEKGALSAGFKADNIRKFDSREDICTFLASFLKDGDVVLVKGSRSMKMERVVERLTA